MNFRKEKQEKKEKEPDKKKEKEKRQIPKEIEPIVEKYRHFTKLM